MTKTEKIFFVYPPSDVLNRQDWSSVPICEFVGLAPIAPFDVMSLSAIAKRRGFETIFKDYALKNETVYDFIRDLRNEKPEFLVLNVTGATLEKDLSILKEAKELLDDTIVIVKGAPFNSNSYVIMQKNPEIDIALRGDIEVPFDEIIQYKDLKDIKGITFQSNEKIVQTKDADSVNLDKLPFLDRSLIDNDQYFRFDTQKPQTVIRVAKGCPYSCFFCPAPLLNGQTARYRNVDLVVSEIEDCIKIFNIRDFIFHADTFNANTDWVQDLCIKIMEKKLKINFCANARLDNLDFSTLRLLKRAGCYMLSVGIESASNEILEKTNKNLTLENIKSTVELIKKAGIQVFASYIIGFPWETKKTIEETYKFAKEINTEYAAFYSAVAYCPSEYFDYINKHRLGEINYKQPYVYPTNKGYNLTEEEIFNYNKKFNKMYYLRLRHILKTLSKANSFSKLKAYFEMYKEIFEKN